MNNMHGGARTGAGRPRLGTQPCQEVLQVRVSVGQKTQFKRLGGSAWLRETIDRCSASEQPRTNSVSLTEDWIQLLGVPVPETLSLPQFSSPIQCGLPSTTFDYDYAVARVNLSKELIRNPSTTFIVQTRGDSMNDCGITAGDLLVVDRGVEPKNGDIVLAAINGEFTVKRLRKRDGKIELVAENTSVHYPTLTPGEFDDFSIIGVVMHCIKKLH